MPSFTEELLGESFQGTQDGSWEINLETCCQKARGPYSAINCFFFINFENSIKDLTFHTNVLRSMDKARQDWKHPMLREFYDSEVAAKLVKAREPRGSLTDYFKISRASRPKQYATNRGVRWVWAASSCWIRLPCKPLYYSSQGLVTTVTFTDRYFPLIHTAQRGTGIQKSIRSWKDGPY